MTGRYLAVIVGAAALAATAGAGNVAITGTRDPAGHRVSVLGWSVDGRRITAIERGDLDSPKKVLVVGCIHGNECAGLAVARRLRHVPPPPETDLWLVPNLNPDGAAAKTRGNARGVDLNRNFPWRWQQRLGGVFDSGPRPLSEPETRIAARLVLRLRPAVSIWFHQHLDLVDDSSGTLVVERRFAAAAGLRLASLNREPGSAVTWESHCLPRGSAFVVELPGGLLTPTAAAHLARAVGVAATTAPEAPLRGICS